LITETRKEGKNLLLSDENLDNRFVQALKDVIDENEWNVTVIVVYRRIHEWLVSWYNQINKTTNLDSQGKVLLDDKGIPYREDHKYWPDEGGRHVPGFIEWYKEFVKHWKPADLVNQHRSIKFLETYKNHFQNIIIYDMHKENADLVVDFMCDILHATESCDRLRNHDVELPKTVNPSINLDHDIIGVYAHEKGLIKDTLYRKDVAAAITKYMKQHPGKQLPRKCDVDVTDQILNWLVDSEKIMFSDIWTSERERFLKELVQSYVSKGLLCDVDVEAAINDDELKSFFQSLSEANLKQYLNSTDGIISHGGISSADRRPSKKLRG
jgi:hypothetical protein